jgi:hypothetical protein
MAAPLVLSTGLVVISRADRRRRTRRRPIPVLRRRHRETRPLNGALVAHSNTVNRLAPVRIYSSRVKNSTDCITNLGTARYSVGRGRTLAHQSRQHSR